MKKHFIHFWPLITSKKDAKKRAGWVLKPIDKYHKKARKVLELGVGIGQVIVNFPGKFDIYGLDYDKKYVDYCKRNIKRGKFFVSSMHNFKINEKFDVIFSVFDSINFLKNFNQWKQTFKSVHNHLDEKGLFIFDMYTPKILKDFKGKEAEISKHSFGETYSKPIIKDNTLTWDFRINKIHKYRFKETIFPVIKVKSALSQRFKILETRLMEDNRRILFICRKK